MKLSTITWSLIFFPLLLMNCSSSSAPVGTGGDFSTFTSQPTAAAFGLAIYNATRFNPTQSGVKTCPGGGTIPWTSSQTNSETTTDRQSRATLNDCNVTLSLANGSFSETLTGFVNQSVTVTNDSTYTIINKVAISGSGDIGFAVDCDLVAIADFSEQVALTVSGTCTFRDAAGQKIVGTGEEMKNLLF